MNNQENVYLWIIDWFETNTTATRKELLDADNKSYFEKGWIDSLKFVSFIMDVEKKFDIGFSNDEFQDRDFSTIRGLEKIIEKHLGTKNE